MFRYLPHFLLVASGYLARADTLLANCYLPNGTALPLSRAYQPCISTQDVFSMCCVLNKTALEVLGENSNNIDTCLENGLCQTPAGTPAQFSRDMCTDPTWKSPNCLNVCTDPSNGGTLDDSSFVSECADGSWCCGVANTTCCDDNLGFRLASIIAPYTNAVSTSTGTTSSTAGTGTSTATSSPAQGSQSSPSSTPPSSNNGAEIGLGAALGVIAIVGVVAGIYMCKKKRMSQRDLIELGTSGPRHTFPYQQQEIQELPPTSAYGPNGMYPAEMDGATRPRRYK